MGRPLKFPIWNPQRGTVKRLESVDKIVRYKALRNSSSSFIKKDSVRKFILGRDDYKCAICGSNEDLEIDHIVSVYRFVVDKLDYSLLNVPANLQTLCKSCNSAKSP